MKNIIVERDLCALVDLEEGEAAVRCCLNPSEPHIYIATSLCDVVCVDVDSQKVLWRQPIGAVAGGPDSVVTGLSFSLELDGGCKHKGCRALWGEVGLLVGQKT